MAGSAPGEKPIGQLLRELADAGEVWIGLSRIVTNPGDERAAYEEACDKVLFRLRRGVEEVARRVGADTPRPVRFVLCNTCTECGDPERKTAVFVVGVLGARRYFYCELCRPRPVE